MSSLVLYNYFRSSTSFRARIALNLKKLSYEYKAVHLLKDEQHSAEYLKINPMAGLPTLVHDGKIIPDSIAIIEYLEEIHPLPALLPQDPYLKARVRQVCEIVNSSMHPYGNLKVTKFLETSEGFTQEKKDQWVQHWCTEGLAALETILKDFSGDFCFGNTVTMADICVYPQIITCQRFKIDISVYSTISKIFANCEKHEAFQKAHPFVQIDTPPELRKS